MHRNTNLYHFLLDKAQRLTDEWYDSLDKSDPTGVYASKDPNVIKGLKQQNFDFHKHLCEVFIKDKQAFMEHFDKWILEVARDEEHLNTPIHFIIREFLRVRDQYFNFINEYVELNKESVTQGEIDLWNDVIIKAFDTAILRFTEEMQAYSNSRLQAQQEMINELSSPVIALNNHTAILPLVGDIETTRARLILENTLKECSEKGIVHLFIDLSGVILIDTMVAHQLFQLIDALSLIGVKTTLSGIRPEIAQTAVQLGLSFEKITTTSTLAQAISLNNKTLLV
ncbi:STAS domain-containing protein [Falsibacillus albus]|uniref:STAS domain-containing protein n=1 Tax=Falsibacillus albus TaxID=2478915 RepID=A0A3L7JU31_9BACI|nr:STAS domain-containing protein [Falsibacillus albus]RLQ94358.1 STAS domain-containing protein [Falsibacillus albus]